LKRPGKTVGNVTLEATTDVFGGRLEAVKKNSRDAKNRTIGVTSAVYKTVTSSVKKATGNLRAKSREAG
jgi:hypothetical protein